jgi:flavin-dependent thymidylate synthase
MKPYAELLEFNQPNPIRLEGFTKIRDAFPGLSNELPWYRPDSGSDFEDGDYYDPERIMEFAGRGDYGESNQRKLGEMATVTKVRATDGPVQFAESYTAKVPILQKYIGMGHQSMIEFGWATFYMEFSRVVLAELTRHRLASYQVESQRFVKYEDLTTDELLDMCYYPEGYEDVKISNVNMGYFEISWKEMMDSIYISGIEAYKDARKAKVAPQDARYLLPNSFGTRLCMATNVREWRHIIGLRLDKSAQPEIRELMQQVYDQLIMVFPNALSGVLDSGRGIR